MTIEFIDHTKSELGEGPTYDPAQNKAWWFDIVGKKLFEHDFNISRTNVFEMPLMASMLGVVDEETQLVATEKGLFIRNTKTNDMKLHQAIEEDNPVTRSNDGRAHPCGAIWIGTMGLNAEKGAGAIYHFHRSKLTKLYSDISISNAICFSPDGASAYFTDTVVNKLMKVTIDPETALPNSEPQILHDHSGKNGGLDGAVVDADGAIWVACWGASAVMKFSSEGQLVDQVNLPVTQPTCPCFVGEKLDQLLVTSAWQGKPAPANTQGDAGKTLLIRLPVKGKPEPRIDL